MKTFNGSTFFKVTLFLISSEELDEYGLKMGVILDRIKVGANSRNMTIFELSGNLKVS